MKSIILLLVIAALVGLIVWQYKTLPVALENQQKKVEDLNASRSVAAQQQCHDQAHARFIQLGLEGQPTQSFRSRYNTQLDKCYLQIENTSVSLDILWKNLTLSEAVSGINLGSYSWRSAPGQTPADVPPFTCEVTMPSGGKTECKSETEFRNLIKAYMD